MATLQNIYIPLMYTSYKTHTVSLESKRYCPSYTAAKLTLSIYSPKHEKEERH